MQALSPQELAEVSEDIRVWDFETLAESAEGLWADTYRYEAKIERSAAAQARSERRRDTRRSLQAGTAAQWMETICGFEDDARERADRYAQGLVFHQFLLEFSLFHHQECSGSANCIHCSAAEAEERHLAAADRWKHIRQLGPNHSEQQTAAPYAPPVRRATDDRGCEYVVEEDELLPEFTPIDFMHLKPSIYQRVSQLVSAMYNWVWEPAGIEVAQPTHEFTAHFHPTPVFRELPPDPRTGRVKWAHDWEPTVVKRRSMKERKPKMKRHYPGSHYIGRSRDANTGERDSFRILVTTIWLERHERYAVYCAWDGGKRDGSPFTHWVPFAWHLVEPSTADLRCDYDPELWDLDRALEVAYLKAKELRIDFGVDQPDAPLPFSPDRLTRIGDAQDASVERRRDVGHDGSDD